MPALREGMRHGAWDDRPVGADLRRTGRPGRAIAGRSPCAARGERGAARGERDTARRAGRAARRRRRGRGGPQGRGPLPRASARRRGPKPTSSSGSGTGRASPAPRCRVGGGRCPTASCCTRRRSVQPAPRRWRGGAWWDAAKSSICRRCAPRSSSTACWSGPAAAAGRAAGERCRTWGSRWGRTGAWRGPWWPGWRRCAPSCDCRWRTCSGCWTRLGGAVVAGRPERACGRDRARRPSGLRGVAGGGAGQPGRPYR